MATTCRSPVYLLLTNIAIFRLAILAKDGGRILATYLTSDMAGS
jgi:hypothetical protein